MKKHLSEKEMEEKNPSDREKFSILNEVIGLISLGIAILILFCLLFPDSVGDVGRWISEKVSTPFGGGAYLLPIILMLFGWRRIRGKQSDRGFLRGVGAILLLLSFPVFLYLPKSYGGGIIGLVFGSWLLSHFYLGSYVITLTALLLGILLLTESSLLPFFILIKRFFMLPVLWIINWRTDKNEDEDEEEESLLKKRVSVEKDGVKEKVKITTIPRIVLPKTTVGREDQSRIEIRTEQPMPYQLPPLSLLYDQTPPSEEELKEDLLTTARLLEETLTDFGIETKVVQVNRGPVITSFEIQPAAGVKVSRIVSLSDDISLALASPSIRIEAPIPGKQAVGIEIPNRLAMTVRIKEILSADCFVQSHSPLIMALGKDITGEPIVADLTKMPHLLVAGATGSGKSVCVNSIINSILYKASPYDVKFIMIDPKMVELGVYNGLPHLRFPVVTKSKEAIKVLGWLVREMEGRYQLLSTEGVRDIDSYNSKRRKRNEEIMPYIVAVIDELADLMMVSAKECEENITRLAQMARAVGIHLILATQRPSVDVITGVIKANLPSRIAFQVFSKVDSRTVLDVNGAEKLLGRGDMLFLPSNAPKPIRLQGSFITGEEVENIIRFIKAQDLYISIPEIELETVNGNMEGFDERDTLFDSALEIVVQTGYASTSMLQRRLKIGYNRAARLIEMMESEGYIGPADGSKPREVYGRAGGVQEE